MEMPPKWKKEIEVSRKHEEGKGLWSKKGGEKDREKEGQEAEGKF